MNQLTFTAFALGLVSAFLLGHAIPELANGIVEVPGHWWSALPLLGVAVTTVLFITAERRVRRGPVTPPRDEA